MIDHSRPGGADYGFKLHLVHQVRVFGLRCPLLHLRRVLTFMPNGPRVLFVTLANGNLFP